MIDVLDNDITARFDPEKLEVQAEHTMRVRLLAPTSTLRLRLHDDFRVASVTSAEGGSLLFFRVRDQGNLVVSLGPLATREEPFTLTTRYSGRHDPAPVDQELVQVRPPSPTSRKRLRRPPPARLLEPHRVVPAPAERGFRHRARADRVARGLAGGDGGRARRDPHRGRAHARRVPPRAARQVRHRGRGPARRRGPAAGGRAGRARLRRHRARTA